MTKRRIGQNLCKSDMHDDRLSGDYKLMSEFLLNYWMQNVETPWKSLFKRQLKATKLDTF